MAKVDIISGFLGAGKTTLIKKLLKEVYCDEQVVLIENEFGEIGIDGTFLNESGVTINEMNSGCICCSLVGDFEAALNEVIDTYHPDRIIIEPSGVGKLSDVIQAVKDVHNDELQLDSFITVVDAKKCRMYIKNFGEFYNNQVASASLIILSRSQEITDVQLNECLELLKPINHQAPIVTTPWDKISGLDMMDARNIDLEKELIHQEHDHHHDEECECGHHHEHHHDEECECGHHHEHHHDEECECGHHHDHHHADDIFDSIGFDTIKKYSKDELVSILTKLSNETILRAKGFVDSGEDQWWYFDLVVEDFEIRRGKPMYTGKVCVIGTDIDENEMKLLFLGE